jgi:CxxC motif-containing protein (DUF1111 family)
MNARIRAACSSVALALALTLVTLAQALSRDSNMPAPGSNTPASDTSDQAYRQALSDLTPEQRAQFEEGSKGFAQRWAVAPSILGRWGRGPTSNGEACTDCHENGGRGRATDAQSSTTVSMLVRLSIPGSGPHAAPRPDPHYGDQLQEQGILGRVPAEGHAFIVWSEFAVTLSDGEVVHLRRPQLQMRSLAFGPLADGIMTSVRVAPALVGVGLLDALPEDAILMQERAQSERGLHGHANRVWDVINQRVALGRFGHKANQPHILQQVVTAYHADLGVTSQWFAEENCPAVQEQCRAERTAGHPELPSAFLEPVLFSLRALAPPVPRVNDAERERRGEVLFHESRCASCHAAQWHTAHDAKPAALADRVIQPYTDLLLHDMGEGLADGRPDFEAGAREWRTAPLWGLGLSASVNGNTDLLHDGRARSILEAILWHGGEAQFSREQVTQMTRGEREALIAFVQSL